MKNENVGLLLQKSRRELSLKVLKDKAFPLSFMVSLNMVFLSAIECHYEKVIVLKDWHEFTIHLYSVQCQF